MIKIVVDKVLQILHKQAEELCFYEDKMTIIPTLNSTSNFCDGFKHGYAVFRTVFATNK